MSAGSFKSTHVVEGEGRTIPVMFVESGLGMATNGPLYTREEWDSGTSSDWELFGDGSLRFQGQIRNGYSFKRIAWNTEIKLGEQALKLGLDDEQKLVRAAQALAILETLEKLPTGTDLSAYRFSPSYDSLCWEVSLNVGRVNRGETLTDALGQLTTVLALEGNQS